MDFSWVFSWDFYGFYKIFIVFYGMLWDCYGIVMGFWWACYGIVVVFLWDFTGCFKECGMFIGSRMVSHDYDD